MNQAISSLRIVLYEGEGSVALQGGLRFEILKTLVENGYAVTCSGGHGEVSPPDRSPLLVLGRFNHSVPPVTEDLTGTVPVLFQNIGDLAVPEILSLIHTAEADLGASRPGQWKPWFPVIDYGRCTNCLQCLSFCLFDVYGVSQERQIKVQNPQNCKTDCPACSRVCPEVAILFPKYRSGPINGDAVSAEDLQREKMKIDISALLGGDIYATLRERSRRAQSRFAKERDEERALKERQRCLTALKEKLDVPPEVLAALPSLEEIEAKAERMFKTTQES